MTNPDISVSEEGHKHYSPASALDCQVFLGDIWGDLLKQSPSCHHNLPAGINN